MKKLINAPADVVSEMLEGLVALYPGLARVRGEPVLVRADIEAVRGQVALISGGGSGHEPAHAGYVGDGMLSAAVAGDVFTSPAPDAVVAALRATAGPAGALLIVKNYTGDRLNFGLAAEVLRGEGVPVEVVVVADDVALAATADHAGRRGLAGTIFVHKVAGAAARAGRPLPEVAARARAAAAAVRTMGVALTPCTVPAVGRPGFELGADEIELGLGIHGEPGVRRGPIRPVDELVDQLLDAVLADRKSDRVALMINNLGGTPTMELTLVARRALHLLSARGVTVERTYTGTFLSALEMAGVSLTLMQVDDDTLAALDAETTAPAWPAAAAVSRPRTTPVTIAATGATATASVGRPGPLREPITRVIDALIAAAPHLTALDQAVGDGDLGISLRRGARALSYALPHLVLDDPARTLRECALILQREMGGTSGPLYSAFLLRAAQALPSDNPVITDWLNALDAGCAAITDLGGARAGDRTMLDALLPAAAAARSNPDDPLTAAAEAAEQGARSTASMPPRRGRASYLGDRALGHVDPGAAAVAIWLHALARRS